MRLSAKCVVFIACWALVQATPAKVEDGDLGTVNAGTFQDDYPERDTRLLFKFITIAPERCTTTSSTQGVCYSAADCTTLAGTARGTCASGLGVCCEISRTCGNTSSFQSTIFQNPSYPSVQANAIGSCQLRITPLNNNICQLRLDLQDFTLAPPNNDGVCTTDFLQVTGGSSNIPTICGENSGQHMYVDVSPQFGSALVNIDTSAAGAKWKINVTQIECNSTQRAPAGCLQYFTETTGMISSFNFNTAATSTATDQRQLSNQAYGICIKSQPGYCSITYRQAPNTVFSLSGDPGAFPPGLSPPLVSTECTTDYLIIPGGEGFNVAGPAGQPTTNADRFCGLAFPDVTSQVQPFNLFLVTNGAEISTDPNINDSFNQGFKLTYRMNPCGTPGR